MCIGAVSEMDPYIQDFQVDSVQTFTINTNKECKEILEVNKHHENFEIIHNNIRSINKNIDEFRILLCNISVSFDCMVLTETWKLVDPSIYGIPGYNMIYNQGDYNQNYGVLMYIKQEYDFEYEIVEMDEIKILRTIKFKNKNFVINAIYRFPASNIPSFNKNLQNFLEKNYNDSNDFCILVGDLNIDILEVNEHAIEYLNVLNEFGYVSTINEPTRMKSCLDNIFS